MDRDVIISFIEYNESILAGHVKYLSGLTSPKEIEFVRKQISNTKAIIKFANSKLEKQNG